jgi:hypothetical protein
MIIIILFAAICFGQSPKKTLGNDDFGAVPKEKSTDFDAIGRSSVRILNKLAIHDGQRTVTVGIFDKLGASVRLDKSYNQGFGVLFVLSASRDREDVYYAADVKGLKEINSMLTRSLTQKATIDETLTLKDSAGNSIVFVFNPRSSGISLIFYDKYRIKGVALTLDPDHIKDLQKLLNAGIEDPMKELR